MTKVFIDTDIIIDYLADRRPFSDDAEAIFKLAHEKKLSLHVSSLSINNIHYIIRKLIGPTKALEAIRNLIEYVTIEAVGSGEIQNALEAGFGDFEDAIQNQTATKIEDVMCIITRNIRDFKKSRLAVLSPDTFLKTYIQNP
jgi:predicted nucleic acid-binding protein